jgi:hypothetical protein
MLVAGALVRFACKRPRCCVKRTVATLRSSPCSRRAPCYRTSRCGNSCAPRRRRWLSSSSPGHWKAPDSCASPSYVSSRRSCCQVRGRGGRNGFVELGEKINAGTKSSHHARATNHHRRSLRANARFQHRKLNFRDGNAQKQCRTFTMFDSRVRGTIWFVWLNLCFQGYPTRTQTRGIQCIRY